MCDPWMTCFQLSLRPIGMQVSRLVCILYDAVPAQPPATFYTKLIHLVVTCCGKRFEKREKTRPYNNGQNDFLFYLKISEHFRELRSFQSFLNNIRHQFSWLPKKENSCVRQKDTFSHAYSTEWRNNMNGMEFKVKITCFEFSTRRNQAEFTFLLVYNWFKVYYSK